MPINRKLPPAKSARAVAAARHYLYRLHQRLAPPQAVVLEMILAGWMSQAITSSPISGGRCFGGRSAQHRENWSMLTSSVRTGQPVVHEMTRVVPLSLIEARPR